MAPLLGFSILLLGRYSRFGIWRQVLVAVVVVILVKMADTAFVDLALRGDGLWPLVYCGSLARRGGGGGAAVVLRARAAGAVRAAPA